VDALLEIIRMKFNFWAYIALMMIGLWAIIAKNNLIKKIIGMSIFQTAIILFYISISAKDGATLPILLHGNGHEEQAVKAVDYINPLPHVLMLTAIVVAVATLGVALALVIKVYENYRTLEEDEILVKAARENRP
jgi:multicomponent Na+:H+ antiporter subunit C